MEGRVIGGGFEVGGSEGGKRGGVYRVREG